MSDGFINTDISELIGKTLVSVERINGVGIDSDEIIFTTTEGDKYRLTHWQEGGENVGIEDINGDLNDLVGEPILTAEIATSDKETREDNIIEYVDGSCTWTFYKFSTLKGYVDIRWIGVSNGHYSEKVSFGKVIPH